MWERSALLDSLTSSVMSDDFFMQEKPPSNDYGIYPYSKWRGAWEYLMFFMSLICILELPYEWFFNIKKTIWYLIPSLIIDIIFSADIWVAYKTGFLQQGTVCLDKASIKARIPLWRQIIYWITPIPFYLVGCVMYLVGKDPSFMLFRILVSFKAIRFVRLYDARKVIGSSLYYMGPISKTLLLFSGYFTVIHYLACIFWFVGYNEFPNNSWIIEKEIVDKPKYIQYFHSVYYILTTSLAIGYGDFFPHNFTEVCVMVIFESIGIFLTNYVISSIVSIVADPTRNSFVNKFQKVFYAFQCRKVSAESMEELLRYNEYVWQHDRDRECFYNEASKLPEGLQKKLALALHQEVFKKVKAFRHVIIEDLERIALALKPRMFNQDDYIVKAGRLSSRMFFITEGKVDLFTETGQLITTIDGDDGCILGEGSLLNGTEEQASAIASSYVKAFELSKEDYDEIISHHPRPKDKIIRNRHFGPQDSRLGHIF